MNESFSANEQQKVHWLPGITIGASGARQPVGYLWFLLCVPSTNDVKQKQKNSKTIDIQCVPVHADRPQMCLKSAIS